MDDAPVLVQVVHRGQVAAQQASRPDLVLPPAFHDAIEEVADAHRLHHEADVTVTMTVQSASTYAYHLLCSKYFRVGSKRQHSFKKIL